MTVRDVPEPDDFPAGLLITDGRGRILYVNAYMTDRFGYAQPQFYERNIVDFFSGGSRIIYQTYLLPLLLHDGYCEELNLALVNSEGAKCPVTLSARLNDSSERIFWSIFSSVQHDKLNQELIEARRLLEHKAEKLHQLSITDELTGLLNRRELKRRAEQLLVSNQRSETPISLLVLDIDYFKKINDGYGHSAGDQVLQEMGRIFHRQGRTSDLLGRVGGEEFVFLLPNTDADQAHSLALRLHAAVGEIRFAGQSVTVSIGIATDTTHRDFDTLFRQGDEAMYQAKRSGRNCTCVFGPDDHG